MNNQKIIIKRKCSKRYQDLVNRLRVIRKAVFI